MTFDSISYEGIRKAPETARFLALSIVEQIRSRFSMSRPSRSASAQDLARPQKQISCDSVRRGFFWDDLDPPAVYRNIYQTNQTAKKQNARAACMLSANLMPCSNPARPSTTSGRE